MKRLITIQQGLKVTKDKSGDKGRFKFRSAEDIFEKAKKYLQETDTAVVVTDELAEVGGRCAIKATATLYGSEGTAIASASGWACLDSHTFTDKFGNTGKSMSNEQATGSASSYARKYALCGLFAIDNDENDPDQPNIQPAPEQQKPAKPQPKQPSTKAPTAEPLNHEEIAAYMALCADIDASENIEQIKANAAMAKGTRYAEKVNAHAIKVAEERGWYTPKTEKK